MLLLDLSKKSYEVLKFGGGGGGVCQKFITFQLCPLACTTATKGWNHIVCSVHECPIVQR